MIIRSAIALLASFVFATPGCLAACADNEQLNDYTGTIAGKYKIGMTLVFTGNKVKGEYFYHSQLKDIALRGVLADKAITLEELDAAGAVVASFSGALGKDCAQLEGHWQKAGSADKLAFKVESSGSSGGELGRRYGIAGDASNATVHANAYKFWLGVKNGDKKTVASVMAYPARAQVGGKKTTFRNANDFIAKYDAIFAPAYRDAIVASVPHNMWANGRGIMLGAAGEVWLNDQGKPFALNNP